MCPQENNKDDKRTDSSKIFTFDDDFHMHSLHCSVSIDEFKRSIESMTTSQTKALHFVKVNLKHEIAHFICLLQVELALVKHI